MLTRLFGSLQRGSARKLHDAALGCWRANDVAGAERLFRRALASEPGLAPAWSNLGQVLWEQGRGGEAIECLQRAVEFEPRSAPVQLNLAVALMHVGRTDGAIEHYGEAIRLDPTQVQSRAGIIKPLRDRCDWDAAASHADALVGLWQRDPRSAGAVPPFLSLLVAFPPEFRLAVARAQAAAVTAKVRDVPPPVRATAVRATRLRIGYVSADLHTHAVAVSAVRLFELHDRARFETFAYSFARDDRSALRRRLEAAFDHFVDVRSDTFQATARRIAADRIDVLVDLMGYTGSARPELFALRPAPLQLGFLGYAGTTGADYMDAIVADGRVIPPEDERWYTEPVLRLPTTYFPTDDRRPLPRPTRRADLGLPDSAFVCASFGAHHKIERDVFGAWLRILQRVPDSLLWLSAGPGEPRLRDAAAAAGVDPARLRFAPRLPDEADYLGRLAAADLFLDTRTYNAHSTAVDALWAGVPVLTVPGEGFAGRVGTSLLHAARLPALVARDLADYEARAVALGTDAARLRAARAVLEGDRTRLPLFDSARFARDLEAGLEAATPRAS